jgi:hypothetical protein
VEHSTTDGMGDNDAEGLDLGEGDNDGHEAGGATPADPPDSTRYDSDPTAMSMSNVTHSGSECV